MGGARTVGAVRERERERESYTLVNISVALFNNLTPVQLENRKNEIEINTGVLCEYVNRHKKCA